MITEWSIKKADGRGEIRISVIRSARKSLGLEVRDANTVLARIPTRVSDRELKAFVENHRSWILEKTEVMAEREENRKSTPAPPPGAFKQNGPDENPVKNRKAGAVLL